MFIFADFLDSSCTYVLARDFVDRNFTILGSQGSISLLTREIAITIYLEDNKVKINNSDTYRSGLISILTYMSGLISVHT